MLHIHSLQTGAANVGYFSHYRSPVHLYYSPCRIGEPVYNRIFVVLGGVGWYSLTSEQKPQKAKDLLAEISTRFMFLPR